MDLGSGVQRRLREVAADAAAPQGVGLGQLLWNADSRSIRYIHGTSDAPRRAVREVTLAGEDRLVLPISTAAARSGAGLTAGTIALPDGMSADVMLFDLEKGVEVASYSGGPPRSIYKGLLRYASSLSPDGRVFAARDPDRDPAHEVILVSMNDGSSRVLRHSFIQVPGMLWHQDGKHLLLLGHEAPDGPVRLYSVPIDGSAPRAIALVGSNQDDINVALSPDGLRVAVTVPGAKTATFLRLDYKLPTGSSRH
jgi:WD40 repeat protein